MMMVSQRVFIYGRYPTFSLSSPRISSRRHNGSCLTDEWIAFSSSSAAQLASTSAFYSYNTCGIARINYTLDSWFGCKDGMYWYSLLWWHCRSGRWLNGRTSGRFMRWCYCFIFLMREYLLYKRKRIERSKGWVLMYETGCRILLTWAIRVLFITDWRRIGGGVILRCDGENSGCWRMWE